jgi:septum formation protein
VHPQSSPERGVTFILASSSPRRRELIASVGLTFEVVPSHVPEVHEPGEEPHDYVARLARDKAAAISSLHQDRWVIAADTTVVLAGGLLEKPVDEEDAIRMLSLISGRAHIVYTAITLENAAGGYSDTQVTRTDVRMLPLAEEEIRWYVGTGEPLDKAGAYAAQGVGGMFIESIEGSFTNVVGLPLATLYQMLKRAGLDPLTQNFGVTS